MRLCKHIGFDGLKDMKKALFNELNETNAPTAQRESSGFFTDIRDYNTITEMADAVKTSSICAIEDTMKLLIPPCGACRGENHPGGQCAAVRSECIVAGSAGPVL